ncbi:MAG: hypothetical protein NTU85_01960 [Candidatus Kaiserbacteria bacterium]|nr:hypothetical protein [Candidatus Kaiserbacteria bacterium]
MSGSKIFKHITRELNAPQWVFFPKGVEKGSIGHQIWLFFAAMTDRREVSWQVYQSHKRLREISPELYSEKAIGMSSAHIAELLSKEKIGSPGQSAQYWSRSAKTLFERFNGDPLSIYRVFGSINAILAFKDNGDGNLFPGFGPKILSLLSLFYAELGLISMPPDAFPVDVHVQRFAISTGIATGRGRMVINEELERKLRPLYCAVCAEEKWERFDLSHAIWLLCSNGCNGCHRRTEMRFLCPVYEECNGSISTKTYFRRGFWDMDAPRHRKGGELIYSLPAIAPLFFKQ